MKLFPTVTLTVVKADSHIEFLAFTLKLTEDPLGKVVEKPTPDALDPR